MKIITTPHQNSYFCEQQISFFSRLGIWGRNFFSYYFLEGFNNLLLKKVSCKKRIFPLFAILINHC